MKTDWIYRTQYRFDRLQFIKITKQNIDKNKN